MNPVYSVGYISICKINICEVESFKYNNKQTMKTIRFFNTLRNSYRFNPKTFAFFCLTKQ